MRYRTTILATGRTTTGIPVPPEVLEALGAGRRPAVRVSLGGHSYRSTVATMGGRSILSLSSDNRAAAGVAAGDDVEVEVEVDTAPREVEVPADLAAALDERPELRASFDALSYSNRSRHVLAVEGAKAADTRQRRIAKVVEQLATEQAR